MKRLALIILWPTLSCVEQQPTEPPPFLDAAIIQAHSPAHHGVSSSVLPASTPDYAQLDGASAAGTAGSLHLSVDASGTISRFPDDFIGSVAVFGYAWVDAETGHGVVAVIHPAIGQDSHQNPSAWHTHPVLLSAGTASSTFCLAGIGTSQGGLSITGDVLSLNMAQQQAGIPASALDVAASFIVVGDPGCPELAPGTRLGVQVLNAHGL